MNELFMVNEAKIIYDGKFNRSGCEAIITVKVQVNLFLNMHPRPPGRHIGIDS